MLFCSLVSSLPSFRLTINELMYHPWITLYPVNELMAREEMYRMWCEI